MPSPARKWSGPVLPHPPQTHTGLKYLPGTSVSDAGGVDRWVTAELTSDDVDVLALTDDEDECRKNVDMCSHWTM